MADEKVPPTGVAEDDDDLMLPVLHDKHPVRRDRQALLARLKRIEGQVRGVQRMIEEDRYCVDVLGQLAAVRAALGKVSLALLEDHTRGCVANAITAGQGEAAVQELMDVLDRLIK